MLGLHGVDGYKKFDPHLDVKLLDKAFVKTQSRPCYFLKSTQDDRHANYFNQHKPI